MCGGEPGNEVTGIRHQARGIARGGAQGAKAPPPFVSPVDCAAVCLPTYNIIVRARAL